MVRNIIVLDQQEPAAIARWIGGRLQLALDSGVCEVAVTIPGGSTPFPIFEELAQLPLDFARLVLWPNDDRIVPEDHGASNTGKIRSIFEPLGARVVGLTTDAQPPKFAMAWLGMGADGHIASLFPNTNPRVDDDHAIRRITPDPLPPEAPFDRITLTIPALLDSDAILFVIKGDEKAAIFDEACRGESDLPVARLLKAATQPVACFS